jgi:hypothetical protein
MPKVRTDYPTRFKPELNALASQPVSVFLPKDLDAIVRSLPNRSHWLRRIISEAVYQELLPLQPPESKEQQLHTAEDQ